MREVTVNSRMIRIRGLKRKELKALKKGGVDLLHATSENVDAMIDRVFEIVLDKESIELLEEAVEADSLKVFKEIMNETFGAADEAKNF